MRILLLVLIAMSGWVGIHQARVAKMTADARDSSDAHVVMYSAPWCDVCDDARSFLDARGVAYTELDINADPAALDAYAVRGGNGAVPLFVIAGESLSGFNAEAVGARLGAVGL